jgi:hypothetical protein
MTPEEATLARPPDPESLGRIRHIVSSAHKWGGDGHHPLFRKIRQVLLRKHPEVIQRAFGGNANVAAAWIKNNWYRMRGQDPPSTRSKRPLKADLTASLSHYREVPREVFGDDAAEMFCAFGDPERSGDLIWVTALRTGEWKVNPIPGKKGPLVVDRSFLDDLLTAWRGGAWEFVTVPTYHTDHDSLANTGFVRDLTIVPDADHPGESLLRAAVEFTEPAVAERVLRGTIAGVSVNVKFNVRHQETGKLYRKVLTHLALTNIPFINGLRAFEQRLAASQDATPEDVVLSYEYEGDLELRNFSEEERQKLADSGKALPDRSFPIITVGDLRNAIRLFGHAKNKARAKAHIIKRARQLGRTDLLPEEWSATMDDDAAQWAAVASAWDPTMDLEYVRHQIEAQVNSGFVMDDAGDLAERGEDDPRTPAHVYVHSMAAGRVLLCAHAASDGTEPRYDVAEANGELRGWVAEYEVGEEGEVLVDPIEEWQPVEKTWVELSRDGFALPIGVEMSGTTGTGDTTPPGGGESMADEPITPKPEEPVVTFTREDAEKLADERAQAALEAYRQEREEKDKARDDELAASRKRLHEMSVKERVAEFESKGHAPTVIAVAREIMLADVAQEPVLSLAREEGEVQHTATDIVTEMLASFPESALTRVEVPLPNGNGAPDSDSVDVRADRIMDFIKGDS